MRKIIHIIVGLAILTLLAIATLRSYTYLLDLLGTPL